MYSNPSKQPKINVITMGCSKNLVDSEKLMAQLKAGNYDVTHEDEKNTANVVIINTCGFINDAKQESINTILEYAQLKKSGKIKKIIVFGCLSERYKEELKKEIPEVDDFYGVLDQQKILTSLNVEFKKNLVGERIITTPSHYAYLKISEGCDRKCSFCAIPKIRGKHISIPIEELVKEAEILANKGVKELILIAQDLSYYGLDLYKKQELGTLIKKLAEIQKIEWIRLHYAYPSNFPIDVIELMNTIPKICKYIDIPLQHISDRVLKDMKRGHTHKETYDLIKKIKETVPEIAIRTTFIVGFPGETVTEFNELKKFVQDSKFERLGVFTYSPEEDTAAYQMKDNISDKLKKKRYDELMQLQQDISLEINKNKIGKILKVIIDRKEGEYFVGRTEFDSPEVDNEILIKSINSKIKIGNFINVRIISADFFDLYGEIV